MGVPGKVVYLHYTVYCDCLSVVLVAFRFEPDGYLVEKELVILLFVCVVGKMFCCVYVFSFPHGVYVVTLNLIASIPGPSIVTL